MIPAQKRAQLGKIIFFLPVFFLLMIVMGIYLVLAGGAKAFSPTANQPLPISSSSTYNGALQPLLFDTVEIKWNDGKKESMLLLDAIMEANRRDALYKQIENKPSNPALTEKEQNELSQQKRALADSYIPLKNAVQQLLEKKTSLDSKKAYCFLLYQGPGGISESVVQLSDVGKDFYFVLTDGKVQRMNTLNAGIYKSMTYYQDNYLIQKLPYLEYSATQAKPLPPVTMQYYFGECKS